MPFQSAQPRHSPWHLRPSHPVLWNHRPLHPLPSHSPSLLPPLGPALAARLSVPGRRVVAL